MSLRVTVFVLLGTLTAFAVAGGRTFSQHHANGDQRVYVAMAMKLDQGGLDAYSAYDVKMRRDGDWIVYSPHPRPPGDLIRSFRAEGTPFYEQPLMHAPPLFPATLQLVHRLWGIEPYQVLAHDRVETSALTGWERFRGQGYAAGPPLLFAMGLIVVAFGLGHELGGRSSGLIAAALTAAAPALYLVSQRVWADSLLALATGVALWAALRWCRSAQTAWWILAALATGAALLTKNNALLAAILALVTVGIVGVPSRRAGWIAAGGFVAIVLVMILPWYLRAIDAFGRPFFNPSQPGIAETNPWFHAINARPWFTYLLGVPYQNPLLGVGGGVALGLALRGRLARPAVALGVYVVGFLVVMSIATQRSEMLGPDHRYLLPAYAPLAAVAAVALRRWSSRPLLVTIAVLVSASWSIWISRQHLDADLLMTPF